MPVVHEPHSTAERAGPPALVANFVEALTPRSSRSELAAQLLSNYTTLPRYCLAATVAVPQTTFFNAIRAFDQTRLIGDIACVFIAFHTLPLVPLVSILVVAALTLLCRDGHTHPPDILTAEAVLDAIIGGAALVIWQLFCLIAIRSFAAPPVQFLTAVPFA